MWKIIKFDDTKIEEYKFYQNKISISINGVDINTMVVSNKFPLIKEDFKYFIGYKNAKK